MSGVTLYSELTPEVASAARAAAERIRVRMSRSAADIIAIGEDLISVRKTIGHGNFLPWINSEFGMSDQAARRFMHVAENMAGKFNTMLDLPPSVLYALAAPSTPEPVREEAMRRVEAGEPVNLDTVMELKRQVAEAKDLAKSAKQDVKVQKSEAQRAKDERDRVRNELDFANAKIRHQSEEIERLKQDGVIHVYPAEPAAVPEPVPVHPAPKPRGDCVRTAMELVSDSLDGAVSEIVALLREGGQFTVASELEAAAARRAEAA